MKIAGMTSRTDTSSGRPSSSPGTASSAAFHVSDLAATDLEREALRDEQHQGGDDDREGRGLERRPPLWPQLLGELRDGHRLEAALPQRLEDVRHGLDGLRPVAALSGAVAIVQEQDGARAQHVLASGDDCVDPGPRRVEDRPVPSDHPVALLSGHRRDERVSEAVGRTEELRRLAVNGGGERAVGLPELVHDRPRAGEHEQRVVLAVAGELVALGHDPLCDVGMSAHLAAEREERRPGARVAQRVEHARRPLGARAVVEGDGDHRLGCRAQADDPSEEAGVRRERRPGHRHQDQDRDRNEHLAGPPPDLLSDHRRHRQPDGGGDYEANDDVALAHTGLTPASRSS